MKKIGFISDIHSNLPALEATLEELDKRGIKEIYCLGDIIGYHSYTNDVIKLLNERGVISIKGNHDKVIGEDSFDQNLDENFVLTWNSNALTDVNREYINSLPEYLNLKFDEITVKIVHGSPASIDQYIREGSEEAKYYLENMDTDILISGHTHIPYVLEKNGHYLLNTGSVGKPKIGKPLSTFIILEVEGNKIEPEIVHVKYSVETITNHLKERSFPKKFITALETGNP